MRIIIILISLLLSISTALAQSDCEALVKAALETADSACDDTARNQACYGNVILTATPREDAADFHFQKAGDIADIANLQSLTLSSMSLTDETWGVALLKLQANLPDTLPGQNVTFLLFGDVSLTDANADIVEVPATAASGVNVRLRPTTNASVIASLRNGQEVTATGQLADGSWIRVRLDDGNSGWVSAAFLDGEKERLLVVEPDMPAFGPMQAFYFTSGYNDRPCNQAPDSGILIQTPEGAGTIRLRVNEVDIQLGSTVYLQASTGDALYVSVLEGHATLTAQGATQIVPAGTVSIVPLNEAGQASGTPEYPQPYAFRRLQNLPVYSALLEQVTVERATASSDIPDAIAAFTASNEPAGGTTSDTASSGASSGGTVQNDGSSQWVQNEVVTFNTCPGPLNVGSTNTWYPHIVFSPDRQSFTYDGGPNNTVVTLGLIADNTYSGVFGDERLTFTFTSPTTYRFSWEGIHGDPNNGGCRFVMEADASLISGSPK
jgi:uncharacterized protein YgiM (DUF1202 family)